VTPKTKKPAHEFSPGGMMEPTDAPPSTFRAVAEDPEFWKEYFRLPRYDVAESIIKLRRLRGMTQAQLARRLGTHQPAIARIEAARSNVGLDTIRALSIALDAVVQISVRPAELCVLAYLDRATSPALTAAPRDLPGAAPDVFDVAVLTQGAPLTSHGSGALLMANSIVALNT
jgi:transcriptional regulator with XRE-family HTH domain